MGNPLTDYCGTSNNGHLSTMATFFCPQGGHHREVQQWHAGANTSEWIKQATF